MKKNYKFLNNINFPSDIKKRLVAHDKFLISNANMITLNAKFIFSLLGLWKKKEDFYYKKWITMSKYILIKLFICFGCCKLDYVNSYIFSK